MTNAGGDAECGAVGASFQREWRCPCAGYKPADSVGDLSENAQQTLADIERLTKTRGLRTCPNSYRRIEWAIRLVQLHTHREKHMLSMVRTRISAAELDAIAVVDRSLSERESYELAEAEKARQAAVPR